MDANKIANQPQSSRTVRSSQIEMICWSMAMTLNALVDYAGGATIIINSLIELGIYGRILYLGHLVDSQKPGRNLLTYTIRYWCLYLALMAIGRACRG